MTGPYSGLMSHHRINSKAEERRLERLAQAESNVRTRLDEMRTDTLALLRVPDKLTCRQPRMHAGLLPGLNNLLSFRALRRR
jgi:hypothetical protein